MEQTGKQQNKQAAKPQRTKEEQELLDWMAKDKGRELTPQEENLALEQARSVGYL
jgi:hypothetical protein